MTGTTATDVVTILVLQPFPYLIYFTTSWIED